MKLTELLEQDKDALLRAMQGAPDRARAIEAVERELERMLFAFNDAAPSPRARENAAAMVGALRAALPLVDCAGEVKVWEHRSAEKGLHITALTLIFLIAGCALCLAAAGLMLYHDMQPLLVLLPLAGGALLILAGAQMRKDKNGAAVERKTEVTTDWEKVYRTVHTAALVMDQTLEETAAAERWEARRQSSETPAISPEEAELMAGLLEAERSGDGEYALEKLSAVRHYLRTKGVEAVEFDDAHAQYFDCMPGAGRATLCPALLQGGQVLRRGMATVPER
jgi:hypothetical protein